MEHSRERVEAVNGIVSHITDVLTSIRVVQEMHEGQGYSKNLSHFADQMTKVLYDDIAELNDILRGVE